MRLISVLGGSTNAVLHFLAIAHAAKIELNIDDFQKISDKTPFLADLKPSGKYLMKDLHALEVFQQFLSSCWRMKCYMVIA